MGFFNSNKNKKSSKDNKEGDKIQLPKLPSLPDLPNSGKTNQPMEEPQKKSTLPSFPGSNLGEKMNQHTIREAITKHEDEKIEIPPVHIKRTKAGMTPSIMTPPAPLKTKGSIKPRSLEMSDWAPPLSKEPKVKGTEPLFIRLDTFEKAVSSFNEVKLRMGEIETLLRNIRELKGQEERELNDWENEIEIVRARLEQIDKEIFERME